MIIGEDLRYDGLSQQVFVDRDAYRDRKGTENLAQLRRPTTDDDLLAIIQNIYGVLLTRGILGTCVYVCDPGLRAYVAKILGAEVVWLTSTATLKPLVQMLLQVSPVRYRVCRPGGGSVHRSGTYPPDSRD